MNTIELLRVSVRVFATQTEIRDATTERRHRRGATSATRRRFVLLFQNQKSILSKCTTFVFLRGEIFHLFCSAFRRQAD